MRRLLPLALVLVIVTACKRSDEPAVCAAGSSLAPSRTAVQVSPPGASPFEARIAALGTAGFATFWSGGPAPSDTDLYARTVSRDGIVQPGYERLTQVAGRSDSLRVAPGPGGIGIVWRDDRFGTLDALGTVISMTAQTSGAVALFRSADLEPDQSPQPAIAALGTAYVVAWNAPAADPEGDDRLFAQIMGADGTAVGAPVALVPSGADAAGPPVAVRFAGGLAIVDAEERTGLSSPPDVFAYVLGTAGEFREVRLALERPAWNPEVAAAGSVVGVLFCTASEEGQELWFATVDASGVRLPERRLARTGDSCFASIIGAGEVFQAVWIDDTTATREVVFQSVSPTGARLGPAHVLAAGTAILGAPPDVAWDGEAAGVVWLEENAGTAIRFRPLTCIADRTGP